MSSKDVRHSLRNEETVLGVPALYVIAQNVVTREKPVESLAYSACFIANFKVFLVRVSLMTY
jgi:hypothetical protein